MARTNALRGLVSQAEIDRAIGASPEIAARVMALAKEAQQYWVSVSPRFDPVRGKRPAPPTGEPGDYQRSVKIEFKRSSSGFVKARVVSHSPMAHWVEYGAAHMPEYAPRAKTHAHFGGMVDGPSSIS